MIWAALGETNLPHSQYKVVVIFDKSGKKKKKLRPDTISLNLSRVGYRIMKDKHRFECSPINHFIHSLLVLMVFSCYLDWTVKSDRK